mmetsp:Transcript_18849/g.41278  ORF Transcript_18849/g.41278 Transcript_18849/m.41278 type:complete len:245 (-) Transcript_18849:586-1320(-)
MVGVSPSSGSAAGASGGGGGGAAVSAGGASGGASALAVASTCGGAAGSAGSFSRSALAVAAFCSASFAAAVIAASSRSLMSCKNSPTSMASSSSMPISPFSMSSLPVNRFFFWRAATAAAASSARCVNFRFRQSANTSSVITVDPLLSPISKSASLSAKMSVSVLRFMRSSINICRKSFLRTYPSGSLCLYWHVGPLGQFQNQPYFVVSIASRKCLQMMVVAFFEFASSPCLLSMTASRSSWVS